MSKITKRLIDAAPFPKKPTGSTHTPQIFLRDSELRGFAVRITPNSKTFILEREIQGRVRRMNLGRYGPLTVEQARDLAKAKIGEIATGHNPAEAHKHHRKSPTFGDLEQAYLARHAITKKSIANDRAILNHHLAHWRRRTLQSLTRDEIAALHTKIGTEPSSVIRPGRPTPRPMPRQANAARNLLRCMFNLAQDWGLHPGPNPCLRIKKFDEQSRDRFVQPDELPRLWAAIQQEPNVFVRAALFVSMMTGARRDEVLTMKWEHLDTAAKVWSIPETKAGRSHLLPIPQPVMEELNRLPRFEGNPYVFVGRWGHGHLVNISKPWNRIKQAAGLMDVRLHDLRRTLGSWLVAQGHSLPLIGKALNHSSVSTTQVYARLQLDPVREALEANAAKMLTLVAAAQEAKP